MKIISLDPGGTTGVAYVRLDKLPIAEVLEMDSWQLHQTDHHVMLRDMLDSIMPDTVICERFENRQLDNVELSAREYIGIAKLWCQDNRKRLVLSSTGSKTLWSNDKLIKIKSYKAAMPHANDAMRHLLYYVTVTKTDNFFILKLV